MILPTHSTPVSSIGVKLSKAVTHSAEFNSVATRTRQNSFTDSSDIKSLSNLRQRKKAIQNERNKRSGTKTFLGVLSRSLVLGNIGYQAVWFFT